eukprot:01879.XXX_5108_5877_1 [CDS] Oithona nana genome sequencing.
MSSKHLQYHREALQRKSQQDWANREYVQLMANSITRIADFLNTFHRSCSGRLAHLDARLESLTRKVVFLESKVGQSQIDNGATAQDSEEEESVLESEKV